MYVGWLLIECRVVRDRKWLISISRMARYHYSVQDGLNLYVYRLEEQNIYSPCWRNGSVFVLHTKGSGSIPLRGTKNFIKNLVVKKIIRNFVQ